MVALQPTTAHPTMYGLVPSVQEGAYVFCFGSSDSTLGPWWGLYEGFFAI